LSQKQFLIMHFAAKEKDVIEVVLEEESNVDGGNYR
jgi:hypothetical protein